MDFTGGYGIKCDCFGYKASCGTTIATILMIMAAICQLEKRKEDIDNGRTIQTVVHGGGNSNRTYDEHGYRVWPD
jgi:hypothetical protein